MLLEYHTFGSLLIIMLSSPGKTAVHSPSLFVMLSAAPSSISHASEASEDADTVVATDVSPQKPKAKPKADSDDSKTASTPPVVTTQKRSLGENMKSLSKFLIEVIFNSQHYPNIPQNLSLRGQQRSQNISSPIQPRVMVYVSSMITFLSLLTALLTVISNYNRIFSRHLQW